MARTFCSTVLGVGEEDRVAGALAHLALAVGAGQRADLGHQRVGLRKDLTIEEVEAARNLARDLDVGLVILAHRHQVGPRHENVGGLKHRVAEQAEGQLLLVDIGVAGHVLDAGQAGQARHGDQHLEDQVELVNLLDRRLDIEGNLLGIDTDGQMIEHQVADVLRDLGDIVAGRLGGEHMQVGDDKKTLIAFLEGHAIGKRADIVAKMELAGGAVAGEDARSAGHGCLLMVW
jgi:hypothetical protein